MKERVVGLACVMLVLAGNAARADGLLNSVKDAPASVRPIHCYVGVYGEGDFARASMDVPTVGTFANLGNWDAGMGGQVGCDYIKSAVMVGLFGDYTAVISKTRTDMAGLMVAPGIGNHWSIGGRVGFSPITGNYLYVLAAYAGASEQAGSVASFSQAFGSLRGVALGGGIETQLTDITTIGVEYRHESYDDGHVAPLSTLFVRAHDRDNEAVRGVLRLKLN